MLYKLTMELLQHAPNDDLNSIEQGELFESLIKLNNCKKIIEIGVAWASTTRYLCRGAKSTGGFVYGYDIWEEYGLNKMWKPFTTREQCLELLNKGGFDNVQLTKIDSMSENFKNIFHEHHNNSVIDFAFIDGDHSYDGIKNDFDIVYPYMSQTGIIAFHDTLRIDGCREFVIDLRTKYNDGTFDVVDFPFGNKNRRVGITLLVKRTYPIIGLPIDEICGSLNPPEEIYQKEKQWYSHQTKELNISIQ